MQSSKIMLSCGIALLFLVALGAVGAMTPCCFPKKMTAEVTENGHKIFDVFVDNVKEMVVEEWGGQGGIDHVVYDMVSGKAYIRRTDGKCRSHKFVKYTTCIPDNANFKHVATYTDQQRHELASFKYMMGSHPMELVVTKKQCVPYEAMIHFDDGWKTFVFTNMELAVKDPSVFDKNLSDCN